MPQRQHLSLLREFVRRDFEGRYAGSVLGFLWSMIQPLWQLLLFGFIFGVLMKIPLSDEPTQTFWIFLFVALMPWLALQEGIQRSTTAITDNANLVKKIHFPSEILVATVVIAAVIHQAIAGTLFLLALGVAGEFSLSGLPLLLLALPLQLALTIGLGFFVAASNIYLRDVSQLQGMLLMAWFYFTPIVYPMAMVRQVETHGPLSGEAAAGEPRHRPGRPLPPGVPGRQPVGGGGAVVAGSGCGGGSGVGVVVVSSVEAVVCG